MFQADVRPRTRSGRRRFGSRPGQRVRQQEPIVEPNQPTGFEVTTTTSTTTTTTTSTTTTTTPTTTTITTTTTAIPPQQHFQETFISDWSASGPQQRRVEATTSVPFISGHHILSDIHTHDAQQGQYNFKSVNGEYEH